MKCKKNIESSLNALVAKVAEKLNIANYEITLDLGEQSKNGFTGEIYKADLINTNSQNVKHLVIKKSFDVIEGQNLTFLMQHVYVVEIYFYTEILNKWIELQKNKNLKNIFKPIPECLLVSTEIPHYLVFENLFKKGFQLWPKQQQLPEDHLTFIFKTYGKIHGLSFVFKKHNPEEFEKAVKKLAPKDEFADFVKKMGESVVEDVKIVQSKLEEKLAKKLDRYVNDMGNVIMNSRKYFGDYSCIIHGDCWSNNLMFKYSEQNSSKCLEEIAILDWQACFVSSPVLDLSYLLYTGGTKKDFDKLDDYLQIYHRSLSDFMSELGEDSSILFPYEALKKDWKDCAEYGFIAALLIMKIKLTSDEDTKKAFVDKTMSNNMFDDLKFNTDAYHQILVDLVKHMHEYSIF